MSLPEITDEDRAVANEAWRLVCRGDAGNPRKPAAIAAALVRTGWRPVDPDLLLARECAADAQAEGSEKAYFIRKGDFDEHSSVQAALAAIKAAVQRERERKG